MTTEQIETTALATITGDVLARIEEMEDEALLTALTDHITAVWAYSFRVSGSPVTGLSSKGVEEAGREMAKMGEALREIEVRLDYEDEQEARFLAKAGRYAIGKNGTEAMLDSAIRGKRVPKFMTRQDGRKVADPSWYEKGITKAARNAKDALIPNNVRALIIAEATKAGRVRSVEDDDRPAQPQRQPVRPPQPRQEQAQQAKDAATRFWAVARRHGEVWWQPLLQERFGSTSFEALDDDEQLSAAELLEQEDKK